MSQNDLDSRLEDLSEGEIEDGIGREVLRAWKKDTRWLPDDFIDNSSVVSTRLVECERRIEREVIITERTEALELSQSEYRGQENEFRSPDEYENRDQHVPQRDRWEEATLTYEVPDTHRETNCSECGGSGRVPCENCGSSGEVRCSACDGTGRQETERECPECDGTGWYDEEGGVECRECGGKGYEIVDENCPECRGTGSVSCPECSGSGELICEACDGEGLTHKLEVLYRKWDFRKSVEHTTHGVPEAFVQGAEGTHVSTREGETGSDRPEHEIETRSIDVIEVDYVYEDPSLIGSAEEESYSVYYVEGGFEQDDYPESLERKVLSIGVVVAIIIVILIILGVLFALI